MAHAHQDMSSKHEDDVSDDDDDDDNDDDDDDSDDDDGKATDTLSELTGPTTSACSKVTPQCRGDQKLHNRALQQEEWDKYQTPSPPRKKRENDVMTLAEPLKKSFEESKTPSMTKGQLPDHVY